MSGKDHENVVKFLSLFTKLRAEIHDDPSHLKAKAAEDEPLRRLCLAVLDAAWPLMHSESRGRERFEAPVNSAFIEAWRDFEAHYFAPLGAIEFAEMGIDLNGFERFEGSKLDLEWEYAVEEAREKSQAIDHVFEFASEQVKCEESYFSESLVNKIETGTRAWQQLTQECGLDVERIFLRRSLIPFTLIPPHVSNQYGFQETLSLFTHFQQAHDAFVFGVPFAALALMRSITEIVLEKHYGATGYGLKALIKSAQPHLPNQLLLRLNRLKDLADSILHFNPTRAQMPANIEREIVSLLLVLRILIEKAPPRLARK